ncbi:hypothetical protein ERJ75_001547600 [Trypanosoma vivax]|nr:hypothetical protein ERJ75_001547600 [Trypanosoma vivax]
MDDRAGRKRKEKTVRLLFGDTRHRGKRVANAEKADREQLKRPYGGEDVLVALARADYPRSACVCIATGHGTEATRERLRRRRPEGRDGAQTGSSHGKGRTEAGRRKGGRQSRNTRCDEGLPRRSKGHCAGQAFAVPKNRKAQEQALNKRALRNWACARRPKSAASDLSGRVQPQAEQAEKRTAKEYASGANEKPRVERQEWENAGTRRKGNGGREGQRGCRNASGGNRLQVKKAQATQSG